MFFDHLNMEKIKQTFFASSFFWKSRLTSARKQEIMEFFNGLTPEQQSMVMDLRDDARATAEWEADSK